MHAGEDITIDNNVLVFKNAKIQNQPLQNVREGGRSCLTPSGTFRSPPPPRTLGPRARHINPLD